MYPVSYRDMLLDDQSQTQLNMSFANPYHYEMTQTPVFSIYWQRYLTICLIIIAQLNWYHCNFSDELRDLN